MPQVPTNLTYVPKDPPPTGGQKPMASPLTTFASAVLKAWQQLSTIVNGQLSFGDGIRSDNIAGVWNLATFPVAPNTDLTLTHNLGRIPVGYLVMTADRAVDVYTGSVAATKTQITLRASVASAVTNLFIF